MSKAAHSPEATPIVPESLAKKGTLGLEPVHLIRCQTLQEDQKPSVPVSRRQIGRVKTRTCIINLGTLKLLSKMLDNLISTT